jgi:hypothetical protein
MIDKTYEMLWDCRYCGQKKLLGLTHRHCPSCGAPEDTSARYFPSDDEKVAVQDHEFVGADVVCPSCREANSKRSKHCRHCGGPLEGASAVEQRSDVVHGSDASAKAPSPAKAASRWPWIVAAVLGSLIIAVAVLVLWKRDVGLAVSGHSWKREIAIEHFAEVTESAFCDSLPAGARVTGRTEKQRGTRKVEDGEICAVRKVDNGDGTFTEKRACEPKYREEPVMAAHCTYRITKWAPKRRLVAEGGLAEAPRWPDVVLAKPGVCLGCEREGARKETYSVQLVDRESGEGTECEFDKDKWRSFAPGSKWKGRQGIVGGVTCDELIAAR